MKLSKTEIESRAGKLSDGLMANVGLKDAKKIAAQVKKNLAAESLRRKNL